MTTPKEWYEKQIKKLDKDLKSCKTPEQIKWNRQARNDYEDMLRGNFK